MKKLLLSLGTLASVVAPVAAVVACGTSTDADDAKPTTGTDGTSGTKNTDGAEGTTGTLGDKVDESKGAAALLQENKDSDIALVKASTLTKDEQKAAIAKINAAKSTVELGVAFLNLNLVQKDAPTTQTAEQKAAQKAKEAQFAKNQAALKAKIANSKLDRAVQMGLNDQVVAATVQSSLDAIEADFNAKVAVEAVQSKVDPVAILSKEKADAIKEVNALTNLNDYEKEVYGRRINNAANKNVISTILTSAKFEDGKGPQINAADHATKATALVIELKAGDKNRDIILNTKAISGTIFVQIKDVKVTVTKDAVETNFAPAPSTDSNIFEVTKEAFEHFEEMFDTIKNYYDNNPLPTAAPTAVKVAPFDATSAIDTIKNEIKNKFLPYRIKDNPAANLAQKALFLEDADKIKTQADFDSLKTKIDGFTPTTTPAPAVAKVDYFTKASDALDAAGADVATYTTSKLELLQAPLRQVKDETSYNAFIAKIAAAKK